MNKYEFHVGQPIKVIRDREVYCDTIRKITPTGRIRLNNSSVCFSDSGGAIGTDRYLYHIEPLAQGETHESIEADKARIAEERNAEATRKYNEHVQRIDSWWNSEGKTLWENRTKLPDFCGKEVFILNFNSNHTNYLAVGYLEIKVDYPVVGESEYSIYTGGLSSLNHNYVNTFSSSGVKGKTLEEAVYNLIH